MKLFDDNGHLTDKGISSVLEEDLSIEDRLNALEHLDECTLCLERYLSAYEKYSENTKVPFNSKRLCRNILHKASPSKFRIYFSTGFAAAIIIFLIGANTFIPINKVNSLFSEINLVSIFNTAGDYSRVLLNTAKDFSKTLEINIFKEDFLNGEKEK